MRSFKLRSLLLALFTFSVLALRADTFQLNNGRSITGEILVSSGNDAGIQVKTGEGVYERVSWSEFSQATLKELARTPKLAPLVEPFIEIPQEDRLKKTEVTIREVPRLALPAKGSLFGGLMHSSVGLFCLLLIYAANIYAGYEIATVRAYPPAMVCGISAVAPIIGPVIFLCVPTRMNQPAETVVETTPAAETLVTSSFASAPANAEHPAGEPASGLHFAHAEKPAAAALPQTEVFQRGQFTFNRRFIETKFSSFFGVVRREAEKDLMLVIKAARGQYVATRISRIAANDMHVEVKSGHATQEVAIPFAEIQEIQVKHKDA